MKAWQKNTLIITLILLLDQITKKLAATGDIIFDTRLLSFTFVKNTGASFSMLQGANDYLIWVSMIFLGAIIFYYHSLPEENRTPLVLLAAGITGNLIDRVFLGYVRDFINLHWWPVFNAADSAMVIGVVWLVILEWRSKK